MKKINLITIPLLAASLLLSSCGNMLMPSRRTRSSRERDESSLPSSTSNPIKESSKPSPFSTSSSQSNSEPQSGLSYEEGKTQVSEEEWRTNFNRVDVLINSNLYISNATGNDYNHIYIDKGKIEYSQGDGSYPIFYQITNVDDFGIITGMKYTIGGNGHYIKTSVDGLNAYGLFEDMGVFVNLMYGDFTYNRDYAGYTCDYIDYKLWSGNHITLVDVRVDVYDGLPHEISCKVQERNTFYSASYKEFGKVIISLPQVNNDGYGYVLPPVSGQAISYSQFRSYFYSRIDAQYNDVSYGKEQFSEGICTYYLAGHAAYVVDMWQGYDGDEIQHYMIDDLVVDDDNFEGYFKQSSTDMNYEYYFDANTGTYYVLLKSNEADMDQQAYIELNNSFFITREYYFSGADCTNIVATFGHLNTLPTMNVCNRRFIGLNITDPSRNDYDVLNSIVNGYQLAFDEAQRVRLHMPRIHSGDTVSETFETFYGYYAIESTTRVTICFTAYEKGNQCFPIDQGKNIYFGDISDDKLIFQCAHDSSILPQIVFEFSEPLNDAAENPLQRYREPTMNDYLGNFVFVGFDFIPKVGADYNECTTRRDNLYSDTTYGESYINISQLGSSHLRIAGLYYVINIDFVGFNGVISYLAIEDPVSGKETETSVAETVIDFLDENTIALELDFNPYCTVRAIYSK